MPETLSQPRVSVVVPAYNQARYLDGALRSALDQTYPDFEILVVDDGSTDSTAEVARRFQAQAGPDRLRYLWQANQGLAGARNTGIHAARGELVALLDSDDQWLPSYLERMVALASEHPEGAVFYCGVLYMDPDNQPLPQRPPARVLPPEALYPSLLRANFLVPSTILMRRAAVEAAGLFDPAFRRLQDWELWLRMLRAGAMFVGLPERLVFYRLHDESLSMDPTGGQRAAVALVTKLFGPDDGQYSTWPFDKRRAYGGLYRYHAVSALQYQEDWQAAASYLALGLQADPTLALDLEIFYELALGAQPIGFRGSSRHLDLEANAQRLAAALQAALQPPALANLRPVVFGSAYQALGLLAYNHRQVGAARRFWLQALRWQPALLRRPAVVVALAKTLVGPVQLARLRRLRRAGRRQPAGGFTQTHEKAIR